MADKKKVTFSINKELLEKFNLFVAENAINKSAFIEKILTEALNKK